jgi:putative ABC transport system substrate-binding protein
MLSTSQGAWDVAKGAATKLGVSLLPVIYEASDLTEANFAGAFRQMAGNGIEAALLVGSAFLTSPGPEIAARMAIEAKLPTMAQQLIFADSGGLMSYGADTPYQCRQAADYVAMILKGANPGNLPVLQATVYQFKLNLKTADAIGITFPNALLAQASGVVA